MFQSSNTSTGMCRFPKTAVSCSASKRMRYPIHVAHRLAPPRIPHCKQQEQHALGCIAILRQHTFSADSHRMMSKWHCRICRQLQLLTKQERSQCLHDCSTFQNNAATSPNNKSPKKLLNSCYDSWTRVKEIQNPKTEYAD
eukprot:6481414-Amphidinium_carterae.2